MIRVVGLGLGAVVDILGRARLGELDLQVGPVLLEIPSFDPGLLKGGLCIGSTLQVGEERGGD